MLTNFSRYADQVFARLQSTTCSDCSIWCQISAIALSLTLLKT
jgi:hypothetical protein